MTKEITLSTLADYKLLWNKLSEEDITNILNQIVENKTITKRFAGELRIQFRGSIITGRVEQAKILYDAINENSTDYFSIYEPEDGITMNFPPQLCKSVLQFLLDNSSIQEAINNYFPEGIPTLQQDNV